MNNIPINEDFCNEMQRNRNLYIIAYKTRYEILKSVQIFKVIKTFLLYLSAFIDIIRNSVFVYHENFNKNIIINSQKFVIFFTKIFAKISLIGT